MNQFFLKAKHWQVFIIIFALPLAIQIWMTTIMMTEMMQVIKQGPMVLDEEQQSMAIAAKMFDKMGYFLVVIVVVTSLFFAWLWALAMGFQNRIPAELAMKQVKFKLACFFSLAYMVAFCGIMAYFFSDFPAHLTVNAAWFFCLIIPFHLLAMFCTLYCFYFTAKAIRLAELQRPLKFDDYAGEFFLLWFAFIGIWILQPRLNRMVSGEEKHGS